METTKVYYPHQNIQTAQTIQLKTDAKSMHSTATTCSNYLKSTNGSTQFQSVYASYTSVKLRLTISIQRAASETKKDHWNQIL